MSRKRSCPVNEYPSHEFQREIYHDWRRYLLGIPWEWICSFTFRYGITYFPAVRIFHDWRIRLIDREKIRVGGYYISAYRRGHRYFHALMIGRNRSGKTLLDSDKKYWESAWPYLARIEPVTDLYGLGYVGSHFRGFKAEYAEPHPFNLSLLRRGHEQPLRFHQQFRRTWVPSGSRLKKLQELQMRNSCNRLQLTWSRGKRKGR
jgi:hypothetical protein